MTKTAIDADAFRNAVTTCLRDELIREPIRLTEGALHCHWHLELTPKRGRRRPRSGRRQLLMKTGTKWRDLQLGNAFHAVVIICFCCALSPITTAAEAFRSRGVQLLYAENKTVCGAIATYLKRIDHHYPRRTVRKRNLLLDVFLNRYRLLLRKELNVPTPVENSSFDDPPDGVPHYALYSVLLDPTTEVRQFITINDGPASSEGGFTSNLYLFKPGTDRAGIFQNYRPSPGTVTDTIPFPLDNEKYRSIILPHFFERMYSDADRDKPIDWRVYHNLSLGDSHAVRLFAWNEQYYILAGYLLLNLGSIVFRIMPNGDFNDTCYLSYVE